MTTSGQAQSVQSPPGYSFRLSVPSFTSEPDNIYRTDNTMTKEEKMLRAAESDGSGSP